MRALAVVLLLLPLAGCLDEPAPAPLQVAPEAPPEPDATILRWRGNVTGDAAVSWSFSGSGRCSLSAGLHGAGGASTQGSGILYDSGSGFSGANGGANIFLEAHAQGTYVRTGETVHWTGRHVRELDAVDGARALVFGRDLVPGDDLDGHSIRIDMLCEPQVRAVDFRASREVVVLSDHGDGNGAGASVGLVASADVGTRLERTFTSPDVVYLFNGQVSAVVDLRVTHPAGQNTHTWAGLDDPNHVVPGGDVVIEMNRAGTPVAFLHVLFFGLHPVASLDGIMDLPAFGPDEWDWDGTA